MVSLQDYRGKVVMLYFWTTWWPHCTKELPSINQLYQGYKEQGFVVLGMDIRESREVVETAVRERGYAFPVLLDSTAEVTLTYQVRATPTVYLVDRWGKLVASAIGPRPWGSPQGRGLLQELLAVK